MACNNQNIGLMTELVYKIKRLSCEVEKLHLEDDYLQSQIDKLALLVGAEGLKGYDTIMETFSNIENKLQELIDGVLLPELDADKYLYNDGEKAYWKEVPEVDLSAVYDLIYSYHPFEFTTSLSVSPSVVETGNSVAVTANYNCSHVPLSVSITDGTVTKDAEELLNSGKIVFDGPYTSNTTFTMTATAKDEVNENAEPVSVSSVAKVTFGEFAYCLKYKTDTMVYTASDFKDLLTSWLPSTMSYVGSATGYSKFSSFTYNGQGEDGKFQYFYLAPTSFNIKSLSIEFALTETMQSLGTVTLKNRYNKEVEYEIFSTNNLAQDSASFKFTIK